MFFFGKKKKRQCQIKYLDSYKILKTQNFKTIMYIFLILPISALYLKIDLVTLGNLEPFKILAQTFKFTHSLLSH